MALKSLAEIRGVQDKNATWVVKNVVLEQNKKPTMVSVKIADIQINQYGTLAEFIEECGDATKALHVLNQLKVEAVLTLCSQRIRYAKRGPVAEVIKKALAASKAHIFVVSRPRKMTRDEFKLKAQELMSKPKRTVQESEALIKQYAGL